MDLNSKLMKQKLFKKGWALLALILCVGIGAWAVDEASGTAVTDPVATVDGTGYATLAEAFSNAGSGSTVQLQKDVEATSRLYISKPMTLDLNGKTISATAAQGFTNLLMISSDGAVTITDTKGEGAIKINGEDFKSTFAAINLQKGTLNLTGGTISAINSTSTSESGRANALQMWIPNTEDIEVNIDGANLYAEGGVVAQTIMTDWAGSNTTKFGKLNFKSGTITAKGNKAWGVTGNTTLEMTGGTITVTGYNEVYGIYFPVGNTHQKEHTISGGTIVVNATGTSSTFDVLYGPAVIAGGKFFLNGNGTSNVFSQNKNDNRYYRLDITGGYFDKKVADAYLNKEVRLVDLDASTSEYAEGLRYKVERAKFHVDVTGYNPTAEDDGYREPISVNANVFKDYSFNVRMPEKDDATVGADTADINITMTGVQTLGLKEGETRSYTKHLGTTLTGATGDLSTWLSNVYAFQGVTVPVTVKSGTTEDKFTYTIGAYDETTNSITGTPSMETDARAAWQLLTSKVSASQDLSDNDTHFLFKRGAYVLIGDEMLVFDQDYDFLKGTADLNTLFSGIRPYVHVQKSGLSGQASNKAVIYLPEGSTLGISSSSAVLNEDAYLTVDGTSYSGTLATGILSGLRNKLSNSSDNASKLAIVYAMQMFNEVVGLVDNADNVPVTLEFKKNKFHVDVTGYSSDDDSAVPVTVNADVFSDYSFDVSLPASGSDALTASKATVNVRMSDVSSLGVSGTRSYSKTVETGVSGVTATLSESLKNTYAFAGATCPVKIIADGTTKEFTYNIAGITADGHIVGTPSSTEDARAAWQLMTSKVSASQDASTDDTHFLFKKGAYLQVGDERLVFLDDFDFLKGTASMETLFDGANVKIKKVNISDANTVKAVAYLPAGSTLGISSSAATVSEDVYVTMDGTAAAATNTTFNNVTGFFTSMKSAATNAKAAILALVKTFDTVVGGVDALDNVSFTVEFKKAEEAKNVKFHVDVTGYDADTLGNEVAVNADVFDDYSFKVSLPDALNDNLSAAKATVNVSMTGVQSLGLAEGETRNYTKTVNTGVKGVTAKLSEYLKNTYAFGGVTAPVQIVSGDTVKSFTYNINGIDEDYNIVGTPSSTEDARAAWHFMVSHVSASQDATKDDAHFLFKKGAYIEVGNEKLIFTNDFDFLKGGALGSDKVSLADLFKNAEVVTTTVDGDNSKLCEVYLPAGSTLGLSSSSATVWDNVTVSMNGAAIADNSTVKDLFSKLKDSENLDAKTAIIALLGAFDAAIGEVDAVDEVSFKVEFTEPRTPKFHVDVTGYDPETSAEKAVSADVYGDYSFDVSLINPAYDALTASKATVNIRMNGVQSLGMGADETRSYSKTVETGVAGVSANLSTWLPNTYKFAGATCPVQIVSGDTVKDFTYNIAGISADYHIIGTPDDEAKAREAWHFMVKHVSASQDASTDDTHFLFKKGSYLQVGDERLVFLSDFDFLKGAASMETLFDGAQVKIQKVNVSGANSVKAVAYLPAGSTLGVSSSSATVDYDVTVTMDGTEKATDAQAVTGFFTTMKSEATNAYTAIKALLDTFDKVVGMVDELDGVGFTVEFTQAEKPKFHVDVTGEDAENGNPIAVNADVYGDYHFVVSLPDKDNDNLTASKATLNMSMYGVQSLGLGENETRSYTKTVETGVTGVAAKLSETLKSTYAFAGATCPVTIKDAKDSKSFDYNIAGINDEYQIIGTPSDEQAARDAWHFMVNSDHVSASQDASVNDTHFLFKKGAYLQIGDEKIVFLSDFDFLKGAASMETMFDDANVRVEKVNISGDNTVKAQVYLPAGSTLGVSSSAATAVQDVYVTMDAIDKASANNLEVTNFFTDLKTKFADKTDEAKSKLAIALLMNYFDGIVGYVDQLDGVNFTVEFKQPETKNVKFHVDVTGEDATTKDPIAVNADVYDDYSFQVSLPDILNDNLSTSVATLNVAMTGVQSLGLADGETRNYSKTVNTGVEFSAKLSTFLTNTYKFDGVIAPVTIKDAKDSKSFTYNIAGIDENYNIIGTPDDEDNARAAWHFMVNDDHLKAAKTEKDDAHFIFKKGSYIQLGNEKLVFTKNFDFLKGAASLENLFEGAEIEEQETTNSDNILAVYLPAGSTLALSTSAATVKQNVKVTMDGAALAANEKIQNVWTNLKNSGDLDAKTAIAALVYAFDQAIGEVDKVEKVNFTVEFTENTDVQYIEYDSNWNPATTEWQSMVTDDNNAYNIDGDKLWGFKVNSDQENVNINFTRNFTEGAWAAWVVPFDMTLTDEILENYEFGYIEGISNGGKDIDKDDLGNSGVTFGVKQLKADDVVKANLPYVVLPKVSGSKTFTVENTTLKTTVPQATGWTAHAYHYALEGIYEDKVYDGGIWYALLSNGKFQKAGTGSALSPFRFFLEITDNDNNPYATKAALRLSILDEATGINSINADVNGEQKIYDLQGRRVYNPTQKGVYIVNGRKVVMGR